MAWAFGDSFDLYAAPADAINGYWDSGTTGFTLGAGRFTGSLAATASGSTVWLGKSSGANVDAVHHFVVSFRQTAAITGATLGLYLQLLDVATNQCCVVFRSDGAILLTSATPAGTVLATYLSAVTAINTWYAFEIEIIISNTVGGMRVRKNGNTSNDYDSFISVGNLNTRPGTNSYANKLQVGQNALVSGQAFDDLLWRSDVASVAWMGDIRCYTRMPASDVSTQFSRVASLTPQTLVSGVGVANGFGADSARYVSFTAAQTGYISAATVNCNIGGGGGTGHFKMALFSSTFGSIGTVLATSTQITNPSNTLINVTFPTPGYVVRGQSYWIGFNQDAPITYNVANIGGSAGLTSPVYASWPASNPGGTTGSNNMPGVALSYTPQYNADLVSEPQQDALTSYVYSSNPTDADFYGLSTINATVASVVMVTTRAYMQKTDAGSRASTVRLKSGVTTVQAPTLTLSSSGFQWCWRTDVTDPNGGAWTPSAANNVTIGPYVVS